MPEMSGPALAAHLRELQPSLRVLFMSGYTDDVLDAAELQRGDTAFLRKPFGNSELVGAIRELLDKPSRRGARRSARRRARHSRPRRRASAPTRSSGAAPNGGASGRSMQSPRSRTRSCAAAMSTERAPLSETTPSTRPAARWQSVIASEPMMRRRCATPSKRAAFSETYAVVVASNERISSSSFGSSVSGCAVQERPAATRRRPLLTRAEVVDVAEDDVVHRARRRRPRSRSRRTECRASRSANRRSGRRRP